MPDDLSSHSARQIQILEPLLKAHLLGCRFCRAGEICDQRGGYECALDMHKKLAEKENRG